MQPEIQARLEYENPVNYRMTDIADSPKDPEKVMGHIFGEFGNEAISDIQVRSGLPIYCHTRKGLEIADRLGDFTVGDVLSLTRFLYSRQEEDATGEIGELQQTLPVESRLRDHKVADFSSSGFPLPDGSVSGRMRVQAHLSTRGPGLTCRILSDEIADLETLGIAPDTVRALQSVMVKRQGFGLVTGQTGSGKSTTLAALLDWLRITHPRHIVTVEDPIEYRYSRFLPKGDGEAELVPSPGFVTQQEVGKHVATYHQGLKDALRKAPHVVLLGEIRDRQTMEIAIEAAQTGHVVISTLHTNGAVKTLSRILEFFPQDQHRSLLGRLSEILMFVLSQGLIPAGKKRVLNYEFLQNNSSAVRSGIAGYSGSTKALEDSLRHSGNIEWDTNLRNLLDSGRISHQAYTMNKMNEDDSEDMLFVS